MKQILSQNDNYVLNFITPKVSLRLMIRKYELDSLHDLIFKKYAILPKTTQVEIKNPPGNIKTYNNVTMNFKGFLKEDKGAAIYTYLLLHFAKKRPKSDISTSWQWIDSKGTEAMSFLWYLYFYFPSFIIIEDI